MRSTRLFLLTVLLVGAVSVVPAAAVPITYVHTGFGSGTLDGVEFGALAPLAFTITAVGDTDNITSCGALCLSNVNITASIAITGLGSFDFITPTHYFENMVIGVVGLSSGAAATCSTVRQSRHGTWPRLSGPLREPQTSSSGTTARS